MLEKYLSGRCTPDEEALIENWYASFENDEGYTEFLSEQDKQRLEDRMRQRIAGNILSNIAVPFTGKRHFGIRQLAWLTTGIAASMIILLAILWHKGAAVKTPALANVAVTISNRSAAISEETLSDGSHIWLMPGATLAYHKYFSADRREVNLSGEAFFEVTKNPQRPFIIYSKNLITKVWGTSFRVRDSGRSSFADVTVMTGKVSVKLLHPEGTVRDEMMIYPSQQVVYLKKEKVFSEKPKANMAAMAIWEKPDISFSNRPIKEVIAVLNKSFQLHISADDKTNNLLLTADFNGLNFPEIMQMLHRALDISYDIHGQNVDLKTNDNP